MAPHDLSVVLVGSACSGKSTVAALLVECLGARLASARSAIEAVANVDSLTRTQLVEVGERLEREHRGEWLVDAIRAIAHETTIVVDAARTEAQLAALKRWRMSALTVFVDAAVDVRRNRFESRMPKDDMNFDELAATPVEREVRRLRQRCELVVDSSTHSSVEITAKILVALDS